MFARFIIALGLLALLGACANNQATQSNTAQAAPREKQEVVTTSPNKPAENQVSATTSPYTYVDSTVLFANKTASVSLRASFGKTDSAMEKGYQFQFRTLSDTPVFLSSISVIAGGQRLFVEEGQIVLPQKKGISLTLPLEDSLFISNYDSALLQFRYNNESILMQIQLHQLSEFIPQ